MIKYLSLSGEERTQFSRQTANLLSTFLFFDMVITKESHRSSYGQIWHQTIWVGLGRHSSEESSMQDQALRFLFTSKTVQMHSTLNNGITNFRKSSESGSFSY